MATLPSSNKQWRLASYPDGLPTEKNGESSSRYGAVSSPKSLPFQRLPRDGSCPFWHYSG